MTLKLLAKQRNLDFKIRIHYCDVVPTMNNFGPFTIITFYLLF